MASHLEPAYAGHPHRPLPVTERLTRQSVILPLFHTMTEDDQDRVVGRAAGRRLGPSVGLMQALLIVGAGGFGREAAEAVGAVNDHKPTYELLGFLDDNPDAAGTEVDWDPRARADLLGRGPPQRQDHREHRHPGFLLLAQAHCGAPRPCPERYATLIHPLASIGRSG